MSHRSAVDITAYKRTGNRWLVPPEGPYDGRAAEANVGRGMSY